MIAAVLGALAALTLLAVATFGLRLVDVHRSMVGARSFQLHFPRNTDPKAVVTALAGLSGIRPAWYWRWLRLPTVRLEVHAEPGRINHYLVVPRALGGVVFTHLRAALPSVRIEELELAQFQPLNEAVELGLSTSRRPLRTEALDQVARAVLSSLQPLRAGERVVVQWLLTPAALARPPRLAKGNEHQEQLTALPSADGYELLPHAEALRAERAKQAEPLFLSVGRVGVVASNPKRAGFLLGRVLGAYHLLNAPGVELRRRLLVTPAWARRRLRRAAVPVVNWPSLMNAAELAGVIGWPLGIDQLPGLSLGGCRQLPPSAETPDVGCVVARSTYPGMERPVAIRPADRLMHTLVTGPTGTGKSNLLLNLITQDMQAGRACVVVDPKGDLVADCLKRVPAHRVRDVIVLDPADDERPVGFDLLVNDPSSTELVAEHVVFIFHQLFSAFWGPRTEDVMRAALLTLMRRPGMTLVDVPLLLNDAGFRRRFVAEVSDDVVGLAPFWNWYDELKPAERSQVIAPLMNKLRATLLRSRVRYCINQSNPGLRLAEALNSNKLVFVPLRKGVLGEEAAALLGSLFVSRLWQTIQGRSAVPENQRRPVQLYIDEVQDYLHLPSSVDDMLAQARGLRLGLTLAHQHLGQFSPEMRQGLLANCRSKVIFQTTANDARVFARELSPYLDADDLQGLGRFEVVTTLAVDQRATPPVTGLTLPPPPETHRSQAARTWSRQHYGRSRAEVDEAMRLRHQASEQQAAVGRRTRTRGTS